MDRGLLYLCSFILLPVQCLVAQVGNKAFFFYPCSVILLFNTIRNEASFLIPSCTIARHCDGGVFGIKRVSENLRTAAGQREGPAEEGEKGERVYSGSVMKRGEFTAVKMTENVAAVGMLEKSPELR